jgi:hypothetical protein
MIKKLSSILFVLSLALFAGCGGGSGGGGNGSIIQPLSSSEVLQSYTTNLKNNNITKALEHVSTSTQDRQNKAFQSMDQASIQKLADAMSRATKEYEDDSKIKYRFTMNFDDGTTVEDTFWLILEDGAWKIRGL